MVLTGENTQVLSNPIYIYIYIYFVMLHIEFKPTNIYILVITISP